MSERETPFQDFIEHALRSEVAPSSAGLHPELQALIDLISEDAPSDIQEEVAAHLALCAPCRKRWFRLMEAVKREERALLASAHYPTLSALLEEKYQRSRLIRATSSIAQRMHSLVPAWSLAGVFGAAVVAAAVCLCVLLPPAAREWARQTPRSDSVNGNLIKDVPPPNIVQAPDSWNTPESLLKGVDAMTQYPLGRAIAMAIGQLREEGVPLGLAGTAFSREQVRMHTVQEGDSWNSIAATYLGSAELWPLIVLLNATECPAGELPAVGSEVRVPVP